MSSNLLSHNQSKTEFLLIGLAPQLAKISDPSLLKSSLNQLTLDSTLLMSDHISRSLYILFLISSWPSDDKKNYDYSTAHNIATCFIHSKLDYCISLFNLSYSLNLVVFNSLEILQLKRFLKLSHITLF